jgi:hypothetical protein
MFRNPRQKWMRANPELTGCIPWREDLSGKDRRILAGVVVVLWLWADQLGYRQGLGCEGRRTVRTVDVGVQEGGVGGVGGAEVGVEPKIVSPSQFNRSIFLAL